MSSLPLVAPPGPNAVDYLLPAGADSGAVLLYFSAHWCPPCRRFTPLLSSFVREWDAAYPDTDPASATAPRLTCVFVSRDQDEEAFREYHETMSFPAVAFAAQETREALLAAYNIQSLPTLLVVDARTGDARSWHAPAEDIRRAVTDPRSAHPSFDRPAVVGLVEKYCQNFA